MRIMTRKFSTVIILLLAFTVGINYIKGVGNEDGDTLLKFNPGVEDLDFLSDLEQEVIQELNLARTAPARYAEFLEQYKEAYVGSWIRIGGRVPVETTEGAAAVNEAIHFLKSTSPCPILKLSKGLSQAAREHMEDQGPEGLISHNGTDHSTPKERMNRFGQLDISYGENINYGDFTAREIVMMLIIDDGVPDRGHRKNIFNPSFTVVGVSCGPHSSLGNMCVIDFAGKYTENR